jgi:hypothetical protein
MEELMAEIIHLDFNKKTKKERKTIKEEEQEFIKEILTIALKYYRKNKMESKHEAVYKMLQSWEDI